MKKIKENQSAYVVIVGIMVLMYILNRMTPLCADDFSYSFVWGEQYARTLSSLKDVLISQYHHYHIINGRWLAHTIAQIFLWIGKPVFNIINTGMYLFLIMEIYFHIFGTGKKLKAGWIVLIHCMLWCFLPAFGENVFWLIGSCNYLHTLVLCLFYLFFYRQVFIEDTEKNWKGKSIILFFLGVLTGASNENLGISILLITGCMALYWHRKKTQNRWMYFGVAGNLIGFLTLLLSPGQGKRLAGAGGFGNIIAIIKRFFYLCNDYVQYMLPILIIVISYLFIDKNYKKINKHKDIIVYMMLSIVSAGVMVASPSIPKRIWIGPIVFGIIALGRIWMKAGKKKEVIAFAATLTLSFSFFLSYGASFIQIRQVKDQFELREQKIIAEKERGNQVIEIDSIYGYTKYSPYSEYGDLTDNPDVWPNTAIARYYGVDKIVKSKTVKKLQ